MVSRKKLGRLCIRLELEILSNLEAAADAVGAPKSELARALISAAYSSPLSFPRPDSSDPSR
jgi:hypothetical protein